MMTWQWLPFFLGAPVWASIGVALFATLLRDRSRGRPRAGTLQARIERRRREAEDPRILSLGEYRLRRMRQRAAGGSGAGHP